MASNQELLASSRKRAFDETFYAFLSRRERELLNQIAAEKAATATKETELAHVQAAKRQVGNSGAASLGLPEMSLSVAELASQTGLLASFFSKNEVNALAPIKQLIMHAMWARFRETGATSADLRQFIADAYGRSIDPPSMSPQLSRLKGEMLLKQKGEENEIWRLTKQGIAHCSQMWGQTAVASAVPRETVPEK